MIAMTEWSEHCILMIGNFLSSVRGTGFYCEDLSERLAEIGWDVIRTSSKNGRLARLFDMMTTTWNKRRLYKIAHVDLFSGLSFIWAECVCQQLRLQNIPYILTMHGGNLPKFAKRWPSRARHLLRTAKVVTTPSDYLLDEMKTYCKDIHLIPNALDIHSFKFRSRRYAKPKLVWLRAFHEIYNPVLAPRVVNILLSEFSDITLIMVGPDKRDGSFQKTEFTAQFLGVSDRIIFQGHVPKHQVPLWLDKGDIFLNTTNVDNMPVSVIEALASGLPVVSTEVGGIPYLLSDNHDALLVPPDDPEAMAQAVKRIITEPGLAERLSRNARQKAEQFDWALILPLWENIIEQTLASSS